MCHGWVGEGEGGVYDVRDREKEGGGSRGTPQAQNEDDSLLFAAATCCFISTPMVHLSPHLSTPFPLTLPLHIYSSVSFVLPPLVAAAAAAAAAALVGMLLARTALLAIK